MPNRNDPEVSTATEPDAAHADPFGQPGTQAPDDAEAGREPRGAPPARDASHALTTGSTLGPAPVRLTPDGRDPLDGRDTPVIVGQGRSAILPPHAVTLIQRPYPGPPPTSAAVLEAWPLIAQRMIAQYPHADTTLMPLDIDGIDSSEASVADFEALVAGTSTIMQSTSAWSARSTVEAAAAVLRPNDRAAAQPALASGAPLRDVASLDLPLAPDDRPPEHVVEHALMFGRSMCPRLGVLALPMVPVLTADGTATPCPVLLVDGAAGHVLKGDPPATIARRLAAAGHPTLRFDLSTADEPTRGTMIGPSHWGADRYVAEADICAALDALQAHLGRATDVALWGFGEAATLATRTLDRRVTRLVLFNPHEPGGAGHEGADPPLLPVASVARAFNGAMRAVAFGLRRGLGRLRGQPGVASRRTPPAQPESARTRPLATLLGGGRLAISAESVLGRSMPAHAAEYRPGDGVGKGASAPGPAFQGPVLVMLAGRDAPARQFAERARMHPVWRAVFGAARVERFDLDEAPEVAANWPAAIGARALTFLGAR